MDPFELTIHTVSQAIETGQIGRLVAVRVVSHLSADHGRVERTLARALDRVVDLIGNAPELVTAAGNLADGQLTALVRFHGGQSALVSAGSRGLGLPRVELTAFGNRGVLSWTAGDTCALSEAPEDERPPSDMAGTLLRAVQESLRTGQSIALNGNGRSADPSDSHAEKLERPPSDRHPAGRGRVQAQQPPYGVLLVAGDQTHQPGYAAALAADRRCRLIGLTDDVDISPRRRRYNEQLARRLGIPMLPNLRDALSRDDVSIVSICAEPRRRGRIIVEAARAGKHLYLDKPLAASVEQADEIVDAVEQAGVVSHMWSFARTPAALRLRHVLDSGELGELTAVHFDLTFAKGHTGTAALGRPRRETARPDVYESVESKREMSNVGVYPLVTLFWLLGQDVRRVAASTGNYFFREHQTNDMEDFGQMLLEMESGLTASISAGRTGWRSHAAGGLNRVCLAGTKGTCVVDVYEPRVEVWADVEPWTAPPRDPEDPMGMWGGTPSDRFTPRPKQNWITPATAVAEADAVYFLDCIEQGRQSDVPATLAAAATEVLMAGYQSAAGSRTVKLPLPRHTG